MHHPRDEGRMVYLAWYSSQGVGRVQYSVVIVGRLGQLCLHCRCMSCRLGSLLDANCPFATTIISTSNRVASASCAWIRVRLSLMSVCGPSLDWRLRICIVVYSIQVCYTQSGYLVYYKLTAPTKQRASVAAYQSENNGPTGNKKTSPSVDSMVALLYNLRL